jgi:thiosulfate dehydrogenase
LRFPVAGSTLSAVRSAAGSSGFLLSVAVSVAVATGCRRVRAPEDAAAAAVALRGPPDSTIPAGPLGDAIRRGRALLLASRDSLPQHVGNRLRCTSCHLDGGRRASGTWVGTYAHYPMYRSRSNTVETIEYRVNDCFRRSMNGRPLATDGRDMRDIVAYLAFLSRDVAMGPSSPGNRLEKWGSLTADTAAGRTEYLSTCARCHGPDGVGTQAAPPVWGRASYNIGAGMARVRTAAAFIKDNMPFDRPGSLTDQQAFDIAAYVNARPRPDFPAKVYDWPKGDAPPDVAYGTLAARRKQSAPAPKHGYSTAHQRRP